METDLNQRLILPLYLGVQEHPVPVTADYSAARSGRALRVWVLRRKSFAPSREGRTACALREGRRTEVPAEMVSNPESRLRCAAPDLPGAEVQACRDAGARPPPG